MTIKRPNAFGITGSSTCRAGGSTSRVQGSSPGRPRRDCRTRWHRGRIRP